MQIYTLRIYEILPTGGHTSHVFSYLHLKRNSGRKCCFKWFVIQIAIQVFLQFWTTLLCSFSFPLLLNGLSHWSHGNVLQDKWMSKMQTISILKLALSRLQCSIYFQYGKTAKYYVYAPGDIDLNILVNRCKEMPRRREHQGQNWTLFHVYIPNNRSMCIFSAR